MPPGSARLPAPPADGLAATVASFRPSGQARFQGLVILTGAGLALVIAKGAWPPPLRLVLYYGVGLGLILLKATRSRVWVGPGWIATRGLVRRSYVRTDQLVSCRDVRSGLDRLVLMQDRDDRKVGVMRAELQHGAAVLEQLRRDVAQSRRDGLDLPVSTATLLGLS